MSLVRSTRFVRTREIKRHFHDRKLDHLADLFFTTAAYNAIAVISEVLREAFFGGVDKDPGILFCKNPGCFIINLAVDPEEGQLKVQAVEPKAMRSDCSRFMRYAFTVIVDHRLGIFAG